MPLTLALLKGQLWKAGDKGIKNRLDLKIPLLPPLCVKGSHGVSGALYLFLCEADKSPLRILFNIRLSGIRLKVTLMRGSGAMACAHKSSNRLHCLPRTTTKISNPYRFSSGSHDFFKSTLLSACRGESKASWLIMRYSQATVHTLFLLSLPYLPDHRLVFQHEQQTKISGEIEGEMIHGCELLLPSDQRLLPAAELCPTCTCEISSSSNIFPHVYYSNTSPCRPYKFVNKHVYFMGFVQQYLIIYHFPSRNRIDWLEFTPTVYRHSPALFSDAFNLKVVITERSTLTVHRS